MGSLSAANFAAPPLRTVPNSSPYVALYFYAFLVIGSFFAINLFIGVVIDKFSRMKEEFEGSAFQTKVIGTVCRLFVVCECETMAGCLPNSHPMPASR